MSAIIIAEQRYSALLDKFKAAYTGGEAANLLRYHAFGELFNEFCSGADQRKFGTKTVDDLVADLTADNGPLSTLKDPKRFLYWAKNVYDTFPDSAKLTELAKIGFSISHAKRLFSLEQELLVHVTTEMIGKDGRLVSTRELDEIIAGFDKQLAAKAVQQVLGEPPTADTPPASAPAAAAPAAAAAAAPKALMDPADDKPDKGKASKDSGDGKKDKNDGGNPPPLKTMKALDKVSMRLLADIPNGFIVVRSIGKKGFDSDKAQKNFNESVANLKATLVSLQEPIAKLIEELEAYGGDSGG